MIFPPEKARSLRAFWFKSKEAQMTPYRLKYVDDEEDEDLEEEEPQDEGESDDEIDESDE
jgi:hypothetical protein